MEYAALDLETTGLDPQRDRVIELGAVAFTADRVVETLHRLVSPGRPVPETILQLTGISPQELAFGEAPATALPLLATFLEGRQPVGHGATMDVDFLAQAGLWDESLEVLDTLDLARILLPAAPSHSLPLLAADLGLDQPRPHRALDDAEATRQLLLRLREEAAGLDERLKESMLALVAPYAWPVARFLAEALAAAPAVVSRLPVTAGVGEPRARPPRQEPVDEPLALAAMLGPAGPLAGALPGYEHRESQLQMLLAVAQVMRRGGTLVVEAGTGTGKSLAYLIPALGRALARGEKVVVSTNTHALQEQLMTKDLPSLREWLPWAFEACLVKGRSNYVSLRRWRRYLAEPCRDAGELNFKLKVLVWIHETSTGDRSELRLQGAEEVLWAKIASDPLDCVGIRCTAEDCFVHRAREEAEAADLIVVNHALLLADALQGGAVLPAYDHLVVDEAHHLEEAATQGLRREVDGPGLVALLDRLAGDRVGQSRPPARGGLISQLAGRQELFSTDPDLVRAEPLALSAQSRSEELFEAAATWARALLGERDESLRLTPALRRHPGWERLRERAQDLTTAMAALDAALGRAVSSARDWLGGEDADPDLRELEVIRNRLAEAAQVVADAFLEPDANQVHWFTLPGKVGGLILRTAPLDVGVLLKEHVFAERRSVVLTSASLAVAGSFDYFCSRVGLAADVETLVLESPFDYLRQALICLPTGLPEPQSPDFDAQVVQVVARVVSGVGRRTLALFTSHRQLRDTYYALKQRRDLDQVLILAQGIDGPRRQVLRSFVQVEPALLLGTASFWEGVDLPGDQLSCVIMARLPFPVPTEPVYAARSERLPDPFRAYALPQAALRLKQGFGRLIRRSTDRGAVVILDARISNRDYGRAFLEVLPPASRFIGPVEEVAARVEDWLGAAGVAGRAT